MTSCFRLYTSVPALLVDPTASSTETPTAGCIKDKVSIHIWKHSLLLKISNWWLMTQQSSRTQCVTLGNSASETGGLVDVRIHVFRMWETTGCLVHPARHAVKLDLLMGLLNSNKADLLMLLNNGSWLQTHRCAWKRTEPLRLHSGEGAERNFCCYVNLLRRF